MLTFFLSRSTESTLDAFQPCIEISFNRATCTKLSRRGFHVASRETTRTRHPSWLPLDHGRDIERMRGELWKLQTRACLVGSSADFADEQPVGHDKVVVALQLEHVLYLAAAIGFARNSTTTSNHRRPTTSTTRQQQLQLYHEYQQTRDNCTSLQDCDGPLCSRKH